MRIAALADIHGNAWALDAVLRDLARRQVDHCVDLGDMLYGPLAPRRTAERLAALDLPTVRGNQDRLLLDPPSAVRESATFRHVERALTPAVRLRLSSLPRTRTIGALYLCHGTPAHDDEPLIENIEAHGVVLRSDEVLRKMLHGVDAEVVLCAHTHVPHLVALDDGRLVVNPGSVGLPAYTDDLPFPHAMESGSPHARYALLEKVDGAWDVQHLAVAYDVEPAVRQAEALGRDDWARWLATGRG